MAGTRTMSLSRWLLLTGLPQGALATVAGGVPHTPHYVIGNTTVNYTYASLMFAGVILVSIALEYAMHKIDHATQDQRHYNEMVKKIYGELTVLGILSFGLTLVREGARNRDGGEVIEGYVLVAFELAHLLIFLVALIYVATGLWAMLALSETKTRWDKVQFQTVEQVSKEGNPANVQCKIFQLVVTHQYGLSFGFDFARYSYLRMAENVSDMLDIDNLTWLVVLFCDMVFLIGRLVSGADCEWYYVYHGGNPCDASWGVASNHSAHGGDDGAHGRRFLAASEAPPVWDGKEQTLLRFSSGPVIVLICCGWLLMAFMVVGRVLNRRRRSSLIAAVGRRLQSEGYPEFQEDKIKLNQHGVSLDQKILIQLSALWQREKEQKEQELRDRERTGVRHHPSARTFQNRSQVHDTVSSSRCRCTSRDPHVGVRHVIPEWHTHNSGERLTQGQQVQGVFTVATACSWLSNRRLQQIMAVSQYLMCNYVGI